MREPGTGERFWRTAALVVFIAAAGGAAFADGLESLGNTDGVLTWDLGTLAPGESARLAVIFAFAESLEAVTERVGEARRCFAGPSDAAVAGPRPAGEPPAGPAWVKNGHTDLALDANGAFFWEGARQALACERGGQLSRFGYYIHYGDGASNRAGVSIRQQGALENLRIVEPVRALSDSEAQGVLETGDGRLRVTVTARMGPGTTAAVEFNLTNQASEPLAGLRFSAYANLESAHDHMNDYSLLDGALGGLLVVDAATGLYVVMTGLVPPVTGYSGVWASEAQLREAAGVPLANWRPFEGLPAAFSERLLRSSIPHPPAPYIEPDEPVTRTLPAAEAEALLEREWLFQAEGESLAARALEEIGRARDLAARLAACPEAPDLAAELERLDALEAALAAAGSQDAEAVTRLYLDVRRVKRRIAFVNPAIDFTQVLFIDHPYTQGAEWPHEARHRNGMMAVPGGRLLVLDGLHPGGAIRKLAGPRPGSFWRPDLSFDATKVLFCYKPHDEKSFHLYEVGVDGSNLTQLTFGDYDDLDPIYLPDGHIMFSTTRCNTFIRCMPYTYAYVLARCDRDGGNTYLISRGNETDYLPTLLPDGRVIYTRWEYTDKALWRIQSLWTINPDGTNIAVYWGNQSVWPDMLIEPRPIPGSGRVMFTGAAHHNWFEGSIGIVDPLAGRNFPQGLTKVTAHVAWPECGAPPGDPVESSEYRRPGAYDAYKTPYPLSERDFLVSARSRGKFRLYLADVSGNQELIYEGAHHIWHALPVKPRERPMIIPDRVAWPGTGAERTAPKPGALYSGDVYQGVPDLPRGSVKHLRVIQMDSRTYSTWTRDARFSGPAVSILQDDGVKRVLGTVPLEADGSVHFTVPPGKALHFQLLDENYRALQTMRSFTGVMPGEQRGCVGCHELHSTAPPNRPGLATRRAASDLTPPPWGSQSIGYERLVQPVLDEHCGRCHQGEGAGREKLDLTLRPGDRWFFKEPYATLVGPAYMATTAAEGPPGIAGALMAENFGLSDPASYTTFRPLKHLSYTSKLIDIALSGTHHGVKVDPVGLRQLIAWVDANCPYRGEEEIRQIPDPEFAGIEALPIRPLCKNAPVIERP
ncbi:MAG: hypothetical protein JXR94_14970 [Candidatus Hydrogenedentes bacterium]|nr:hypothetical protein [Candidatus Hydrogenedentota bacterium]